MSPEPYSQIYQQFFSTMLLDLPHEIIQHIADHVGSSRDLISLAQTCSTLYSFAMPLIWADLVVDHSRVCRKFNYDYSVNDSCPEDAESWNSFLDSAETSDSAPLQFVRSLTINMPVSSDTQKQLFARLGRLFALGHNSGALALIKKIYVMDSPLANNTGLALDLTTCVTAAPNAEITIYNTVLSRLEQLVIQQCLGARITDINISVRAAEFGFFADILKPMRAGLQKLTITDTPHDLSLWPISNFTASQSSPSMTLALEDRQKGYTEFSIALRQLGRLTHLALPNSMDTVFKLDWLPASTTSLVCHTLFDTLWLPQALSKPRTLLPSSLPSGVTSLQLSVPITKPIDESRLVVPFTNLTSLDLWTATCVSDFTCRLITASRGTLQSIRLSHIDADILACIAETQAASIKTLIVDDWDYIQQASVVTKLNNDEKDGKAEITNIDNNNNEPALIDPNSNPNTNIILSIPNSDKSNSSDNNNNNDEDEIDEKHLTPFALSLKTLLQSCALLQTIFLTITPFSVNKSVFLHASQRSAALHQMFIKYKHQDSCDPEGPITTATLPVESALSAVSTKVKDNEDELVAVRSDRRIKPVEAVPELASCDLLGPYLYYHRDAMLRPFLRVSVFQVQCS